MARRNTEQQADAAEQRERLEKARLRTDMAKLQRATVQRRIKKLASYDGATKSRRDKDWTPKSQSADAHIIPDLPTLQARARQAVRDNSYAKSIIQSFKRNVVGRGITPSPAARFRVGTERTSFNQNAKRLFRKWADNPRSCDAEQTKTFWQIQKLAIGEFIESGEFLIVYQQFDNGLDVPNLRLQCVEAEQLDLLLLKNRETGNEIRGGIEINTFGAPVAYWIHQRTPNDLTPFMTPGAGGRLTKSIRIPAERVLHFFDPDRVGQVRGVTELHACLRQLRNTHEYEELEMWNARMEACAAVGFERVEAPEDNETIGLNPGSDDNELDDDNNREITWQPGMAIEGLPGEKLVFNKPVHPSNSMPPFMMTIVRSIAAGVDLSYEQVARDFHQGNFSSQRQSMLEDRRTFNGMIQMCAIQLCAPIYSEFLTLAVLDASVDIEAPATFFQDIDLFCQCDWQGDAWEWIDPAKEAAAMKLRFEQRVTWRDKELNRMGTSAQEVAENVARDRQTFADSGVELPEDAPDPSPGNTSNNGTGEARPRSTAPQRQSEGTLFDELAPEPADGVLV